MATSTHTIQLYIKDATGLHETGKIKKQDPYVVVHSGNNTYKTKPDKRAGTDPVWEEELLIEAPPAGHPIKFTIYDKNMLVKDNVIGVAEWRASSGDESLPVFTADGTPAGRLNIRASGKGLGGAAGATHGVGGHTGTRAGTAGALGAGAAGTAAAAGTHGHRGVGAGATHGVGGHTGAHAGTAGALGTAAAGTAAAAGAHGDHGVTDRGVHLPGAHHGTAAPATAAGAGQAYLPGTRRRTHGTAGDKLKRTGSSSSSSSSSSSDDGRTGRTGLEGDMQRKAHIGTGLGAGAGLAAAEHGREYHAKGVPGMTGEMSNLAGTRGVVCDQKFYAVEEDRPIVKEVKQYVREHHPVQREMIQEVKPTGREIHMPGQSELVGVQEQVVDRTIPKPCPDGNCQRVGEGVGTGAVGGAGHAHGTGAVGGPGQAHGTAVGGPQGASTVPRV